MTDTLRLFIAIELPGEVREVLGRLQHDLQRRGLERLRWVRPEGIHLTLKFLGETPANIVPEIEKALGLAVTGVGRHDLGLGKIGTFGGRNPRVLWIDLEGELQPLLDLQNGIDNGLDNIGFPRESRPFSPHLTLARVRPESAREIAGALENAVRDAKPPTATIPVREVSLMRSTLQPSGAIYERLAGFPLAARSQL